MSKEWQTHRHPPLKDLVGLCWSSSSNPRPRQSVKEDQEYIAICIPARREAARAGPLAASISASLEWTSANLDDRSSLASSKRFSSPSVSKAVSFVSSIICSFIRWSRQTSAFRTESIADVSSPITWKRLNLKPTWRSSLGLLLARQTELWCAQVLEVLASRYAAIM